MLVSVSCIVQARIPSDALLTVRFHAGVFRDEVKERFDYLNRNRRRRSARRRAKGTHSSVGEHLTEAGEQQWIFSNGLREVVVAQAIVVVFVHLLERDFHQLFDALVEILVTRLLQSKQSARSPCTSTHNCDILSKHCSSAVEKSPHE